MFKGLKDMGNLVKQAREMKSKMTQIQNELKKSTFKSFALGKDIEVLVNGELEILDINISEDIFNSSNKKKLEKGLQDALNSALKSAKNTAASELSKVTGGMNLPGLT